MIEPEEPHSSRNPAMLTAADAAAAFSFIDTLRRWTRTRDRTPFKVSTRF